MPNKDLYLPTKRKIEEIIAESYKKKYGTNYDEYSLENAKTGALIFADWLMNNV